MEYDGNKYLFVKDARGSVLRVIDSESGVAAQELAYDDWGKVISDTNPGFQPFGFAGGIYDNESKLVHFGVRDYDSEVGSWISKDPILFNGGSSNLYGYSQHDPVNFVDPNGQIVLEWCLAKSIWDTNQEFLRLVKELNDIPDPDKGETGNTCPVDPRTRNIEENYRKQRAEIIRQIDALSPSQSAIIRCIRQDLIIPDLTS
jgi:RHS repeat-associated protein